MSTPPLPTAAKLSDLVSANDALRLRIAGKSVREIAEELGIDHKAVTKTIREAADELLAKREEYVNELVFVQNSRLELLLARLLRRFVDDPEAVPTKDEVRSLLGLFERQSRLLGLDAPNRQEHSHSLVATAGEDLPTLARMYGIETTLGR